METAEAECGHDEWFIRMGRAACAWEIGRYAEGLALLDEALERTGDDARTTAWVLGDLGLVHAIRHEFDEATSALQRSLDLARQTAWNAFVPYPEAVLAIVEVGRGDIETAQERLEHAFAFGCQIRDCCWEGIAAAGLTLVEETKGNVRSAVERFEDAMRRSVREPDAWLYGHAFVLDLKCAFGVRNWLEGTRTWVADLEALASHTMMREFLARAYLYRHDLDDADALAAAETVAADVDNPELHRCGSSSARCARARPHRDVLIARGWGSARARSCRGREPS